jgi:hypothetical protein
LRPAQADSLRNPISKNKQRKIDWKYGVEMRVEERMEKLKFNCLVPVERE